MRSAHARVCVCVLMCVCVLVLLWVVLAGQRNLAVEVTLLSGCHARLLSNFRPAAMVPLPLSPTFATHT